MPNRVSWNSKRPSVRIGKKKPKTNSALSDILSAVTAIKTTDTKPAESAAAAVADAASKSGDVLGFFDKIPKSLISLLGTYAGIVGKNIYSNVQDTKALSAANKEWDEILKAAEEGKLSEEDEDALLEQLSGGKFSWRNLAMGPIGWGFMIADAVKERKLKKKKEATKAAILKRRKEKDPNYVNPYDKPKEEPVKEPEKPLSDAEKLMYALQLYEAFNKNDDVSFPVKDVDTKALEYLKGLIDPGQVDFEVTDLLPDMALDMLPEEFFKYFPKNPNRKKAKAASETTEMVDDKPASKAVVEEETPSPLPPRNVPAKTEGAGKKRRKKSTKRGGKLPGWGYGQCNCNCRRRYPRPGGETLKDLLEAQGDVNNLSGSGPLSAYFMQRMDIPGGTPASWAPGPAKDRAMEEFKRNMEWANKMGW